MKRGKESNDHIEIKRRIYCFWRSRGYFCLYEECLTDVVAFKLRDNQCRIICNEYERSVRHVSENVRKNLSNSSDLIMVVVANTRTQKAVRRKLIKEFDRRIWIKISVVLSNNLNR